MARYFLQQLSIEGFRGIHNEASPLTFTFRDDAVNSVFAPNGAGKSSIFEALAYAFTGNIPKLDRLQESDQPQSYINNRFHSKNTATIALELKPDDGSAPVSITVVRGADGSRSVTSSSGYADPEALLRQLASEFLFLDYATFQEFIDDSPLNRGRSFASLLGLSRISEYRQALETLAHTSNLKRDFSLDELATRSARRKQRVQEYDQLIAESYQALSGALLPVDWTDDSVCADAIAALRGVPLLGPHIGEKRFAELDCDELEKVIKEAEKGTLRAELSVAVTKLGTLRSLGPKNPDAETKDQRDLKELIALRASALAKTEGAVLKAVYNAALTAVNDPSWKDPVLCPVCGKRSDVPLKDRIRELLGAYADVERISDEISKAWASCTWARRLEDLETNAFLEVDKNSRVLGVVSDAFRSGRATTEDLEILTKQLQKLDKAREVLISELDGQCKTIEGALPPSLVDLTKKVTHAKQIQAGLKGRVDEVMAKEKVDAQLKRRELWCSFIQYASKSFSSAESKLSQQKTQSLETSYLALFRQIMANDEISPKAKRGASKESLHLRLDPFYGLNDLTATALLSESYRNALAISIYLSAARQNAGAARFVVLDDVTSSFDAGHQWMLMEVLRTQVARPANPDGPQLIFLSHDGLLEKYFDRVAGVGNWHHFRLQGTSPKGRAYAQMQSPDRLKVDALDLLTKGEVGLAQPLVRQYLEYLLLQVIRKVSIPVPYDFAIKDTNRMVGNCLEAIDKAVKLQKSANSLILTLAQENALITVNMPAIIGNWIAHYETATSASVAPGVLRAAILAADGYCDCFKYDCKCGGPVKRRFYRNLKEKDCSC